MTNPSMFALSAVLSVTVLSGSASANTESSSATASVSVGVAAASDTPAANQKAEVRPLRKLIWSAPLRFGPSAVNLGPAEKANLRKLIVPLLVDASWKTIVIEGHSDQSGSEENNHEVAMLRAERVGDYLVTIGLQADKIVLRSAGATKPILRDQTPLAARVNRRVELALVR